MKNEMFEIVSVYEDKMQESMINISEKSQKITGIKRRCSLTIEQFNYSKNYRAAEIVVIK